MSAISSLPVHLDMAWLIWSLKQWFLKAGLSWQAWKDCPLEDSQDICQADSNSINETARVDNPGLYQNQLTYNLQQAIDGLINSYVQEWPAEVRPYVDQGLQQIRHMPQDYIRPILPESLREELKLHKIGY